MSGLEGSCIELRTFASIVLGAPSREEPLVSALRWDSAAFYVQPVAILRALFWISYFEFIQMGRKHMCEPDGGDIV